MPNKFLGYLIDRDNTTSQYTQRLEGMSLAQDDKRAAQQRAAGAVGLGLLAFVGYRSGAFRNLIGDGITAASRFRGIGLRSLYEGTSEFLSSTRSLPAVGRGPSRVLQIRSGSANILGFQVSAGNIPRALSEWRESVGRARSRLARDVTGPMKGELSGIERLAMMNESKKIELRQRVTDEIRWRRILANIVKETGEGSAAEQAFLKMSQIRGTTFMVRSSRQSFDEVSRKISDVTEDVREEIWRSVQRYGAPSGKVDDSNLFQFRSGEFFGDSERAMAEIAIRGHAENIDNSLVEALRINQEVNERMYKQRGLRQATIGDLDQRGLLSNTVSRPGRDAFNTQAELMRLRDKYGREIVDNLSAGRGLYINRKGDLVNISSWSNAFGSFIADFATRFEIPVVHLNPLRLLHVGTLRDVASQDSIQFLSARSMQPALSGRNVMGEGAIFIRDRVYSLLDPNRMLADNVYMTSSRFGPLPRMQARMLGISTVDRQVPEGGIRRGLYRIGEFFDIGMQEQPNIFQRFFGVFSKFRDPTSDYNKVRSLMSGGLRSDDESTRQLFREVADFVDKRSKPIAEDIYDEIRSKLGIDDFYKGMGIDFDLSTDESTLRTLEQLIKRSEVQPSALSELYGGRLRYEWDKYVAGPDAYLRNLRVYGNRAPVESLRYTEAVRTVDDLRKLLQKESMIHTISKDKPFATEILNQMFDEGGIFRDSYRDAQDTILSLMMDNTLDQALPQPILNSMSDPNATMGHLMQQFANRHTPWWQMGQWNRPEASILTSHENLVVRRYKKFPSAREWVASLNNAEIAKSTFSGAKEWAGQFFAGRHNLENVTTGTFISYGLFDRLNDAIQGAGLALSNRSLSSPQGIFSALMLKRVLPITAGIGYLGYLNWETENLTGINPRDEILGAVRDTHIGYARVRDALGITDWAKRQFELMPGFEEHAFELPILGFFNPAKSAEELEDWYEDGVEPVRKGRWWPLGNTPFTGSHVMYYQPNYYNRMTSDYKMTDVLYGSYEEYFANWWLPTPRYPLAPMRHFFTDPYHWEDKHYFTRPYPVTGPITEIGEIPIIGGLLTPISNFLKPPRRMHQETLAQINYEAIERANQMDPEGYPIYAYRAEDGSIGYRRYMSGGARDIVFAEDGYPVSPNKRQWARHRIQISGINQEMIAAGEAPKEQPEFMTTLSRLNLAIKERALETSRRLQGADDPVVYLDGGASGVTGGGGLGPAGGGGEATGGLPGGLFGGIFGGGGGSYVGPLEQIDTVGNLEQISTRAFDELADMAGIYGYAVEQIGGERLFGEEGPVLESSSKITSMRRAFWDLNLGGFPGNLSEIGRRFVPRPKTGYDELNPIPNMMPDWMPGPEYFIDFQHGDPYTKVPAGEMRLPGPGYEAINELHPDHKYGPYGAFDRFKILADVAPYSKQYTQYLRSVIAMDLPPELQQEVQEIRNRVEEQKRRRRFVPYKFKYADEEDPRDPDAVVNNYSRWEIAQGRFWETLLHWDTPFHTKFMQVRSPLESYKRRDLYGKDWQSWDDPIGDYLRPTVESYASKDIPIWGIALGIWFGRKFGTDRLTKNIGGLVGGLLIGKTVADRYVYEATTGETWIPERRRVERDIEEYFDILEYMKYRGLAERYGRIADATGDADAVRKARLYTNKYLSTMYGANPYGPMFRIMSALPRKDRYYFEAFLDAPESEREEILEVVPSYVGRFLKARWGMPVERQQPLEEYFRDRYLPGPDWEGWEESKDLEDIKVRVVKHEGIDATELNIWPEDEKKAMENNAPYIPFRKPNIAPARLRRHIMDILKGRGLDDVYVEVIPRNEAGIDISFDLFRDRTEEMRQYINMNMGSIMGG